jgi:hypothetical protein
MKNPEYAGNSLELFIPLVKIKKIGQSAGIDYFLVSPQRLPRGIFS